MTHWIATHPWTAIAATCALASIVGIVGCSVAFLVGRLTAHWQLWSLALLLLAAPAVANDPPELTREDHVQRIDQNAVFCPNTGNRTLDQLVFHDWYPMHEESRIVAWRMRTPPPGIRLAAAAVGSALDRRRRRAARDGADVQPVYVFLRLRGGSTRAASEVWPPRTLAPAPPAVAVRGET